MQRFPAPILCPGEYGHDMRAPPTRRAKMYPVGLAKLFGEMRHWKPCCIVTNATGLQCLLTHQAETKTASRHWCQRCTTYVAGVAGLECPPLHGKATRAGRT